VNHFTFFSPDLAYRCAIENNGSATASGQINVSTTDSDIFFVVLHLGLGKESLSKLILAPPRARIPFLVKIVGAGDYNVLMLHGTIKTGSRAIDLQPEVIPPYFFDDLPWSTK
jgi:hypothetical protein